MFFKQLATKESSLSYFFGCGGLGKAVAVDVVAGDGDWFIEAAREAKVEITHVITPSDLSLGRGYGPTVSCGVLRRRIPLFV